jgi:hypothetical protein
VKLAFFLLFQLCAIAGLCYIVWRNLMRNETSYNWRPHWRPAVRYSGNWWFSVVHNVAALLFMIAAFVYCVVKFVIIGD